jgi:signal transduction histidine kinase
MGAHMLPGRERWRALRRSIRFTMTVILAVPVAAAVVMWAFAGLTISNADASHGQAAQHSTVLNRIGLADAVGLAAILIAAAGMVWFARRLSRDAASLEMSARRFADQQLPQLVERLRRGDEVDLESELAPSARVRITELARAAAALTSVERTALTAAVTETNLRSGISQVFVSLARRSQSLLQRQLRLLDDLESKAVDPGTLADLFPLDHLTTRMRRHAEGLIILSGAVPGRAWSSPVPVIDVVRGAMAEVEDYKRITVVTMSEDKVAGSAVADMIHLLAELIENAALFSPSGTRVEVKAERVGNGFAFEIEDRGLGIKPEELDVINLRLSSPADFDLANADQLGLFVVGKLAARHGVRVFLRPSPYGGTTAIVLLPSTMITPEGETPAAAQPEDDQGTAASFEDLQLALTGRPARRASSAAGAGAAPGRPGVPPDAFPGRPDTDGFPSLPGSIPSQSDADHDRVGTPAGTSNGRPGPIPGQPETHHGHADGGPGTPDTSHGQSDSSPSPADATPSLPAFFLSQPTFLSRPVFPGQPDTADQPHTADRPDTAASRPSTAADRPALPRRKGTAASRPGIGASRPGTTSSRPDTAADRPALPRRKGTTAGQSGTIADRLDTAADPLGAAADRPGSTGSWPDTAADPVLPRRAGGSPDAGTYRGLPRRVRQANLSPHLRNSQSPGTAASSREPQARSPEQAQSLLASLQSGWERGRRAEMPDSEATASGQDTGASMFEVPQEEP